MGRSFALSTCSRADVEHHSDDVWRGLDFLVIGSKLLGFCHMLHSRAAACHDCTADSLACGDWWESVDSLSTANRMLPEVMLMQKVETAFLAFLTLWDIVSMK